MRSLVIAGLAGLVLGISATQAAPIKVVAAENVYGDIAQQIGGSNVDVDEHPDQSQPGSARVRGERVDGAPDRRREARHLQRSGLRPVDAEAAVGIACAVAQGDRGRHGSFTSAPATTRTSGTTSRRSPRWRRRSATRLSALDPDHRTDYAERHVAFERSMQPLVDRIAAMRKAFAGTAVTATEPVFDYMADALGLKMRNGRFQLAVMNGTEPSAKGHRRIREGSQDAIGQGAALQQSDQQRAGRAHAHDRNRCRRSGRRRHRNRAAGDDLPAVDERRNSTRSIALSASASRCSRSSSTG